MTEPLREPHQRMNSDASVSLPGSEHALVYVECDVPDGMTLRGWRRARTRSGSRTALRRWLGSGRRARR